MSELFDIQVLECTKREKHPGSRKPTKKCAMKMKETNKEEKNNAHVKMLLMKGRHTQRTGENDLNKLRVNDS